MVNDQLLPEQAQDKRSFNDLAELSGESAMCSINCSQSTSFFCTSSVAGHRACRAPHM